MLPREALKKESILGYEFSGIDSKGHQVMGLLWEEGISTWVSELVFIWNEPDIWSLSETASVPVAYLTAFYAVFIRYKIKGNESILIHDGNGAKRQ